MIIKINSILSIIIYYLYYLQSSLIGCLLPCAPKLKRKIQNKEKSSSPFYGKCIIFIFAFDLKVIGSNLESPKLFVLCNFQMC